jgi:hypothetical protein
MIRKVLQKAKEALEEPSLRLYFQQLFSSPGVGFSGIQNLRLALS